MSKPRDKMKIKILWLVFWIGAGGIGIGWVVNEICRWYVALPVRLW
jgi:hypothetical protein